MFRTSSNEGKGTACRAPTSDLARVCRPAKSTSCRVELRNLTYEKFFRRDGSCTHPHRSLETRRSTRALLAGFTSGTRPTKRFFVGMGLWSIRTHYWRPGGKFLARLKDRLFYRSERNRRRPSAPNFFLAGSLRLNILFNDSRSGELNPTPPSDGLRNSINFQQSGIYRNDDRTQRHEHCSERRCNDNTLAKEDSSCKRNGY